MAVFGGDLVRPPWGIHDPGMASRGGLTGPVTPALRSPAGEQALLNDGCHLSRSAVGLVAKAGVACADDGLGTVGDLQLGQDVGHVVADGFLA